MVAKVSSPIRWTSSLHGPTVLAPIARGNRLRSGPGAVPQAVPARRRPPPASPRRDGSRARGCADALASPRRRRDSSSSRRCSRSRSRRCGTRHRRCSRRRRGVARARRGPPDVCAPSGSRSWHHRLRLALGSTRRTRRAGSRRPHSSLPPRSSSASLLPVVSDTESGVRTRASAPRVRTGPGQLHGTPDRSPWSELSVARRRRGRRPAAPPARGPRLPRRWAAYVVGSLAVFASASSPGSSRRRRRRLALPVARLAGYLPLALALAGRDRRLARLIGVAVPPLALALGSSSSSPTPGTSATRRARRAGLGDVGRVARAVVALSWGSDGARRSSAGRARLRSFSWCSWWRAGWPTEAPPVAARGPASRQGLMAIVGDDVQSARPCSSSPEAATASALSRAEIFPYSSTHRPRRRPGQAETARGSASAGFGASSPRGGLAIPCAPCGRRGLASSTRGRCRAWRRTLLCYHNSAGRSSGSDAPASRRCRAGGFLSSRHASGKASARAGVAGVSRSPPPRSSSGGWPRPPEVVDVVIAVPTAREKQSRSRSSTSLAST